MIGWGIDNRPCWMLFNPSNLLWSAERSRKWPWSPTLSSSVTSTLKIKYSTAFYFISMKFMYRLRDYLNSLRTSGGYREHGVVLGGASQNFDVISAESRILAWNTHLWKPWKRGSKLLAMYVETSGAANSWHFKIWSCVLDNVSTKPGLVNRKLLWTLFEVIWLKLDSVLG